ncbi:putative DNA-binding domain-containing protein [Paraburkholderia sp. SIMBA_030]|uniref:HvfC/BufC family peptide modification chaperone n=1 Tax=Paraburkholderia sp. SIMBA_030 TaxID=3085773 RepID=UPI00397A4997
MNQHSPTLLELQRSIQRSMLDGVDGDATSWVAGDRLNSGMRLGIYRNTSVSVMTTALRLVFPAVHRLVGEECFEGASRLFAAQAPPRSAWLDEYGSDFPAFLAQLPHAVSVPYLADVARLEWQVNLVLHAPETPPLELARLTALSESQLAQTRLVPRPEVRLMRCECPADAIWRAVLGGDDRAMAKIDLADAPVCLRVWRTESGPEVVRLSENEWRMLDALFSGQPLHAALTEARGEQTYALLAAYLAHGYFRDLACNASSFAQSPQE